MYIKRNKRHQTSVSIFMTDNYTNNYFSFFSLICTQREIKYNECFIFCINVVWKKVIKESLIFVCQIFLWKKVIKKNFDFCLSNFPLKQSNQKNFDFCQSNCPLKESNRKNFDFCQACLIQDNCLTLWQAVKVWIDSIFEPLKG